MNLRKFIANQNWIFAKTYANKAPHEYICRDDVNGTDAEFVEFVNYIRENGFVANFWRKPHA